MKAKFETFRNKNGDERLGVEKDGEHWILDWEDAVALYYFIEKEFIIEEEEG